MKILIKQILASVFFAILFNAVLYLFFSFYATTFDIKAWSIDSRGVFCFIGLAFTLISAVIGFNVINELEGN